MKFKYGDLVRILKEGFYENALGLILDLDYFTPSGPRYEVRLNPGSFIQQDHYFDEHELEIVVKKSEQT